jgi:hypothetical protein
MLVPQVVGYLRQRMRSRTALAAETLLRYQVALYHERTVT